MDDIVLITLLSLVVLILLALPIGLVVWVAIISGKVNKLQQQVLALQKACAVAPRASTAATSTAVTSATNAMPIASRPSVASSPYAAQTMASPPVAAAPPAPPVVPAAAFTQASPSAPSAQLSSTDPTAQLASPAAAPLPSVQPAHNVPASQVGAATAILNDAFEAQLPPSALGAPTAIPTVKSPAPAQDTASASSDGDMANFMLGNLFNKLGAIVVIIAVGIFVKLMAPYVFFSPLMKLGIGYLAGTAALGAGLFLHRKEKFRNYGEVLVGLGLAIDFIITYCSCTVFAVWSDHTALIVSCGLLALVYVLAASMQRPSMLILGLLAGYANLAIDDGISHIFTIVYLCLLSVMTLVTIYRGRMWMWVSNINLALTVGIFILEMKPHNFSCTEAHFVLSCIALWAIYVIFDMLRYRRGVTGKHVAIPSYFNFLMLSLYTGTHMVTWEHGGSGLGSALIVISMAYGALAFYYGFIDPKVRAAHLNMSLLALMVGIEVCGWGIMQVVVLVAGGLILAKLAAKMPSTTLANWSLAFLFASPWSQFVIAPSYPLAKATQALSWGQLYLFQIGLPAAGFLLASRWLRANDSNLDAQQNACQLFGWTALYTLASVEIVYFIDDAVCGWWRRVVQDCSIVSILTSAYAVQWFLAGQAKSKRWMTILAYCAYVLALLGTFIITFPEVGMTSALFVPCFNLRTIAVISALIATYIMYRGTACRLFPYIAFVLALLGVHQDALSLAERIDLPFAVTLVWLIYAATVVLIGIYKPHKDCMYGGIVLVLLTVWRLFMIDAADLASIYKLFLFMAVGGALLGLSFFYTKSKGSGPNAENA